MSRGVEWFRGGHRIVRVSGGIQAKVVGQKGTMVLKREKTEKRAWR